MISPKDYKDAVAQLPCLACEQNGIINHYVCLHHIRHNQGMGQRSPDTLVIPLCEFHHASGGYGYAFHAGPRTWQRKFGREVDLVRLVRKRLTEQGYDLVGIDPPPG